MFKKISIGVVLLIALVIAYNLVIAISQAVRSGDRLSEASEVLYRLQIKNKELKKRLTEITSPEKKKKEARDKLGLSKKGETIVIIPEKTLKMVLGASNSAQLVRFPNWLGWLKVFFH